MKVLIVFYSTYGHIFKMAEAVAEGAREVAGAEVHIRRVPETLPAEVLEKMGAVESQKTFSHIPFCTVDELAEADAILFGTPTRFGNMAAPLKYFLDTTGSLWVNGDLIGKPAGVFTSTNSLHGGQETTLLSMMLPLLHHGMIISGIPYSEKELASTTTGGTPYGASHVVGDEVKLSGEELALCRTLGERVGQLAKKLGQ